MHFKLLSGLTIHGACLYSDSTLQVTKVEQVTTSSRYLSSTYQNKNKVDVVSVPVLTNDLHPKIHEIMKTGICSFQNGKKNVIMSTFSLEESDLHMSSKS